jgi:hypothetical protein
MLFKIIVFIMLNQSTTFIAAGLGQRLQTCLELRNGHSCALVKNKTTGCKEIVAVGGGGGQFHTVEIFKMETSSWRTSGATFFSYNFIVCRPEVRRKRKQNI